MYALYQCYQQDKEEQQALDMLLAILQVDKNNENALSALAQFYADKEDGDALNKLIAQYQGTDAQKLLSQYEVQAPTVSETPTVSKGITGFFICRGFLYNLLYNRRYTAGQQQYTVYRSDCA